MTDPSPARRGRPRSVTGDARLAPREEILRHAAALFSRKGITATRLADIAASVGVTPQAIYYHFANLDAIVEELLRYVVDESAVFATAAAKRPGPAADRLASLIARHVERLTAGPYDLWFVVGRTEEDSGRFPAVHRRANQWRRAVAALLREGVANGEFRTVDVTLASAVISGIVYGSLQVRHERGTVSPAEVAAFVVSALRPSR